MPLPFSDFGWLDLIDIVLVALLLYQLYKLVKGTVAIRIFLGILAIYVFWKIVEALKMELLTEILGQFISVGVIALIIVFQQELRRFLLLIGTTGFKRLPIAKKLFKWSVNEKQILNIKEISEACFTLSKDKIGALLIIQKHSDIEHHITIGQKIGAEISSKLLQSIFVKTSPLHDGAVLIQNNTISAASCILPVSNLKSLPTYYGLRHRSAHGISELTDCISVVVSEESGNVMIIHEGQKFDIQTQAAFEGLITSKLDESN